MASISIKIGINEKYTQTMLKSCAKNHQKPLWSHLYTFWLLDLKLYMHTEIAVSFLKL